MAKKWTDLTRREKFIGTMVSVGAVLLIGGMANAAGNTPTPTVPITGTPPTTQQQAAPVVTTKAITETSAVPFTSMTVNDGTMASGTTKVTTQGADGVRTKTWAVSYTDGTETGRILKSDEVTTQPVAQVTSIGTYVAPAPTPAPAASASESSGATAKCRDGSLSYSQHRSGTCSHHGGVSIWY